MGLNIGKGILVNGAVQIVFEYPVLPINLVPPIITGNFVSGSTVTVSNGEWKGVPNILTYSYQWQLNSVTVVGATSKTFILTDSMAGKTLTATVTATNAVGSNSITTISYYINAWGPGQWTVSNTASPIGTTIFRSTTNYIYRTVVNNLVLTRTQDGVAWGNVDIPISNPTNILQAGNRIVIWKSGTNNAAYTTNEGTTWTNSNISVNTTTNMLNGASDGANIIITRGDPASNNFIRSTDLGSTWANVNVGPTNYTRDIKYGNGVFLTVGDYSNATINSSKISSDGGVSWTNSTFIRGTSIAYGDGKFVVTYPYGAADNPAYASVSSDNGNSWTQTRLPDQGWSSVVFADHHFVTAEGGGNIMYSGDGITWTGPYRTIPLIQAGSGIVTYLPTHSLLMNGSSGNYVTHTITPYSPSSNPNQPTNVIATSLNSTQATLSWTAPVFVGTSPILNYQIQAIGTDGASNVTQNTSGPVTSYTFTGLVTGKSYYFNVAAVNSSGVGLYTSSEQTIQIVPAIGESYGGGKVVEVGIIGSTICSTTSGIINAGWSAAQSFCLAYSQNGYSDWQMPDLVQMDAVNSNRDYIDGYTSGYYWTTTPYNPAMPGWYWMVNMPTGTHTPSNNSAYVRAIRVQFY